MSVKPILFNMEMVRAILDGRKTETRRVIKFKPGITGRLPSDGSRDHLFYPGGIKYPPYCPGDILYVRETWQNGPGGTYLYKASAGMGLFITPEGKLVSGIPWHPSIHMPREAARIFLRVTDVRVERLLTPFFAPGATIMELRKEGVTIPEECGECIENYGNPCCIDGEEDSECGILDEVRGDFSNLWDSTIKKANLDKYGWAANPWVWVIAFERISKEEAGGDER